MKSEPVSYIEDSLTRKFSRFDEPLCIKTIKAVIFKATEFVEKRIAELMVNTKGAIIHFGWTRNGMHYIGVFASFMRRVKILSWRY